MPAATHFDLVTHWHLDARPMRVWDALADTERWPEWWPNVREVRTLRAGGADGVGRVRRLHWSTRLPYRLVIDVEALEVRPPERLRARSQGALQGEGLWLLEPHGDGTLVTYLWRVDVTRPWMRRLAPVLAPAFRWNHHAVMRRGETGLARYLAAAPH